DFRFRIGDPETNCRARPLHRYAVPLPRFAGEEFAARPCNFSTAGVRDWGSAYWPTDRCGVRSIQQFVRRPAVTFVSVVDPVELRTCVVDGQFVANLDAALGRIARQDIDVRRRRVIEKSTDAHAMIV